MSMGSDLREAIIEDRVEEAIQKRLEAGEFYTAEQVAEQVAQQMSEQKELLIESHVKTVKKMMNDGIALDKSLQYIPEEYQDEVRKIISE